MRSVTFIGGGNMAEALVAGLLGKQGDWDIVVSEPSEQRRSLLESRYGSQIRLEDDNIKVLQGTKRIVVLAVKPQQFSVVAEQLRDTLRDTQATVLSVMAGITVDNLAQALRTEDVVRVMPNIAAKESAGLSVWYAGPRASAQSLESVKDLLMAVGDALAADEEWQLDAVTALSGSGIAYVFAFMEKLQEAAVKLGLSSDVARRIVLGTVHGGTELARASGEEFAELRRLVTSPNGTTAAALEVLESGGFGALLGRAVDAAYKRSLELGSDARQRPDHPA